MNQKNQGRSPSGKGSRWVPLKEATIKKGNTSSRPSVARPSAPKGQGGSKRNK